MSSQMSKPILLVKNPKDLWYVYYCIAIELNWFVYG